MWSLSEVCSGTSFLCSCEYSSVSAQIAAVCWRRQAVPLLHSFAQFWFFDSSFMIQQTLVHSQTSCNFSAPWMQLIGIEQNILDRKENVCLLHWWFHNCWEAEERCQLMMQQRIVFFRVCFLFCDNMTLNNLETLIENRGNSSSLTFLCTVFCYLLLHLPLFSIFSPQDNLVHSMWFFSLPQNWCCSELCLSGKFNIQMHNTESQILKWKHEINDKTDSGRIVS